MGVLDGNGLGTLWAKCKQTFLTPSDGANLLSQFKSLYVDNKIDEPASEGTSGQVLTTDGAGGRSWTTVQGGGSSGVSSGYQVCGTTSTTALSASVITTVPLASSTAITYGSGASDFTVSSSGVKCLRTGKVRISGSVYIAASSGTARGIFIFRGSTEVASQIVGNATAEGGTSVASKIVSVSANNILYLKARSIGVAGTAYPTNAATWLLVEYVE